MIALHGFQLQPWKSKFIEARLESKKVLIGHIN